jgi:trimethylamine--corrinoid protein Co-methyltransferase
LGAQGLGTRYEITVGTLPAGLALDAIRDVGPGGHYFGTAHTLERFETAFYSPIISDWRNFESWDEGGRPTADQKANAIWQKELEAYERPPMDAAIEEELDAFVSLRKSQGGAPTDF